jgi:hypothetical protein
MMQTTDDQRSKWYEQENSELAKPQRFPLTGDNLVTQRVIESGPFNGGEIGPELAAARYRDHQWDQERSSALQQTSSTNRDSLETRSVGAWQKLAGTQTDTAHNAESETQTQQQKLTTQRGLGL